MGGVSSVAGEFAEDSGQVVSAFSLDNCCMERSKSSDSAHVRRATYPFVPERISSTHIEDSILSHLDTEILQLLAVCDDAEHSQLQQIILESGCYSGHYKDPVFEEIDEPPSTAAVPASTELTFTDNFVKVDEDNRIKREEAEQLFEENAYQIEKDKGRIEKERQGGSSSMLKWPDKADKPVEASRRASVQPTSARRNRRRFSCFPLSVHSVCVIAPAESSPRPRARTAGPVARRPAAPAADAAGRRGRSRRAWSSSATSCARSTARTTPASSASW